MSGILEIVTLKKTIFFLWSCPMDECEAKGKKKAKSKDSDSMPSEYNRCQEIKARTGGRIGPLCRPILYTALVDQH